MGRKIRFAELVKTSGQPQVATLWTEPKEDRAFLQAIKENRILSVKQNVTGHKKDLGRIGFIEERNMAYFIFPHPLPENREAEVVGIDYELVHPGKAVGQPVKATTVKGPKKKPRLPVEKSFCVTIKRSAVIETAIEVQAPNGKKAAEKALAAVRSQLFDAGEAIVRDEVRAVDPS